MSENGKNYVVEKVRELIAAPTCCKEAKAAGQNWLDAIGTEGEAEAAKKLIAELEAERERLCTELKRPRNLLHWKRRKEIRFRLSILQRQISLRKGASAFPKDSK